MLEKGWNILSLAADLLNYCKIPTLITRIIHMYLRWRRYLFACEEFLSDIRSNKVIFFKFFGHNKSRSDSSRKEVCIMKTGVYKGIHF